MHHGGHVQLDQLLIDRIPPAIGERRVGPVAAGRIGIEVAADEPEFLHAAFQLADAVVGPHARRLGQLAHADEIVGIERADAVDQVVAHLRPVEAHRGGADMVRHARGARREDGDVGAALALELELGLHARAHLVVAELEHVARGRLRRLLQGGDLALAVLVERFRRGGVVAVAVDYGHGFAFLERDDFLRIVIPLYAFAGA